MNRRNPYPPDDPRPGLPYVPDQMPEDIPAEKALISTMGAPGAENTVLDLAPLIHPKLFVHPWHRDVAMAMVGLVMAGGEMNAITLRDHMLGDPTWRKSLEVHGGFSAIVDLLSCEEVGRPIRLVEILQEKARLRELIRLGAKVVNDASTNQAKAADIATEVVTELVAWDKGGQWIVEDAEDGIEAALSGRPLVQTPDRSLSLLRFGIPKLDRHLVALPGALVIIAGRPSTGKTALALQALLETGGLLVSLEMGKEEVDARLMSHVTGLESRGFLTGEHRCVTELGNDWALDRLRGIKKVTKFPSKDFAPIAAFIRHEVMRRKHKLVVVDYFSLMNPPDIKGATTAYKLGEMSKGLKNLADDLGICIVLLSQFNRQVKDGERPSLEHLRETGQLEQDANVVVFLYTEKTTYEPDDPRGV